MNCPDPDPETILANKEEVLIIALDASTLTYFLQSKKLFSSLIECIGRGKPDDIKKFRDNISSLLPRCQQTTSSYLPSPSSASATSPVQSAELRTSPPPTTVSIARAKEHFSHQHNGARRLKATTGFIVSSELTSADLNDLSSGEATYNAIQYHKDPLQRLRHLSQSIRKNRFVHCLLRLLYAHEVDEVARSGLVTKGKRLSGAFGLIAKTLGISKASVAKEYLISKNYKLLLKRGGSGSFLLLGDHVQGIWDYKITDEDIDSVLDYRETHLPWVDEKSHKLDKFVREIIFITLVGSGWDRRDLESTSLGQILRDEERQEKGTTALTKRSRGNQDEAYTRIEELDNSSEGDGGRSAVCSESKRQKRDQPPRDDCNQVSYGIQSSCPSTTDTTYNISSGMSTYPVGVSNLPGALNFPSASASGPSFQLGCQEGFGGNAPGMPFDPFLEA